MAEACSKVDTLPISMPDNDPFWPSLNSVPGRLTTRWRRPGVRRDLHMGEQSCYLGEQELGRSQAPQIEAVGQTKCEG
jgi:hypothetical protein